MLCPPHQSLRGQSILFVLLTRTISQKYPTRPFPITIIESPPPIFTSLLWLMDSRSSNPSSNICVRDAGFPRLLATTRNHRTAEPISSLSSPTYSYRSTSSSGDKCYSRAREPEYEQQHQLQERVAHARRGERLRYGGACDVGGQHCYRSANLSAEHHYRETNVAPTVNPFDQYLGVCNEEARAVSGVNLGYHTFHNVPAMVESESSENEGQYSADDSNSCRHNRKFDMIKVGSEENKNERYRHGQQHHSQQKQPPQIERSSTRSQSTMKAPPVRCNQPPRDEHHEPPHSLKKPPPCSAPPAPAAASARPTRGTLLRNRNFSVKLLEVSPGEHMRLRGK